MGYSEAHCKICHVSFNVGRIRQPHEPTTAAWDSYGIEYMDYNSYNTQRVHGSYFVSNDPEHSKCGRSTGCQKLHRHHDVHVPPGRYTIEDEAFHFDSDADSSPNYSFISDASSTSSSPAATSSEVGAESSLSDESATELLNEQRADASAETLYGQFKQPFLRQYTLAPATTPSKEDLTPCEEQSPCTGEPHYCRCFEHIAGPGCNNEHGYNGHNITAEEMKGCVTCQCIVKKDKKWQVAHDDEDFEVDEKYFLTGLCTHVLSSDAGFVPKFYPERHRCDEVFVFNYRDEETMDREICGAPFHPTCFEVYKRASLSCNGTIDVEAFGNLLDTHHGRQGVDRLSCSEAVKRGRDQWWRHWSGDEFLAANPCFVPKLTELIQQVDRSADKTFDLGSNAFDRWSSTCDTTSDSFACLPEELRMLILSYLGSKDVTRLRLASRTFYSLPQYFFRNLLKKEMPWLWEIWCTRPYSIWIAPSEREMVGIQTIDEAHAAEVREIQSRFDSEDLDLGAGRLLREAAEETYRQRHDVWRAKLAERCDLMPLDLQKVDYYQLYLSITRNWLDLRGLRNRERIWSACGKILDMIEEWREKGMLP